MTSINKFIYNNGLIKSAAYLSFTAMLVASPMAVSAYNFTDSSGDVEFSIGGYAKLSAIYSDTDSGSIAGGSGGTGRTFYVPSTTPVGTGTGKKVLDLNARESRINFKAKTTNGGHKLGMVLEMDFLTTTEGNEVVSNSYAPRLRHFFFTFDNWLFGQTWSTFMDTAALPDAVDFLGASDSTVFIRQSQVRYTAGSFQIALENPETYTTEDGAPATIVTDDNTVPDIAANYKISGDWGHMKLNGLFRQLKIDNGTHDTDDTVFAAGISGKIKIGSADDLRFAVNYGDGMGRYTGLGLTYDAIINTGTGEFETIESTTAFVAYRHAWNGKTRSSLIYSMAEMDNPIIADGAINESASSIQINVMHSPIKKVTFGLMYLVGNRETQNADEGDLNRIQATAKYDF